MALIAYCSDNEYMAFSQKKFDAAVCKVVSNISPGRVLAYGEVARAAGYPRHARMVSQAMSRSATPLPWHRVVRSNRTLAFEIGSAVFKKQKSLLAKEGVILINDKVIPLKSDASVGLDELLWGQQ